MKCNSKSKNTNIMKNFLDFLFFHVCKFLFVGDYFSLLMHFNCVLKSGLSEMERSTRSCGLIEEVTN